MRKALTLLILFCSLATFSQEYLKVIYISSEKSPCDDTINCLKYRENTEDNWKILPYLITGFNAEPGYEYCLLMEVSKERKDTITFEKYRLIEIRSKAKKERTSNISNKNSIPTDVKWFLYKLRTKDGTRTFSISKAYLIFQSNNQITGNTDCNNLFSSYSADSTALSFGTIGTTKMYCKKNTIENDFLFALSQTTQYKINSRLLYMYKGKSLFAVFIKDKR